MTNTLASDNGEYFAATVYDEGSAQYALYTWKDGQDAVQVSKNAYDKDIGYITNKGKVIYSDVGLSMRKADSELCSYMYTMRPESLHS